MLMIDNIFGIYRRWKTIYYFRFVLNSYIFCADGDFEIQEMFLVFFYLTEINNKIKRSNERIPFDDML